MIEIHHLVKKYGKLTAVDDLNLTMKPGKIYGLLGKNGAGKTTTMNIITGYIAATSGDVVIGGHNILEEPELAKKQIGYLPEIPPLYQDMTVCEYLDFAAELKGIGKKERAKMVDLVMADVKIEEMGSRLIRNLSKGYKQRVGLAQALLGYPPILILDEPTVGLDPKQMIEMRQLIRKLGEKHTVILSSHILSEVSVVCDYVFIISEGKIVASDTVEKLEQKFASEQHLTLTCKGSAQEAKELLEGISGITKIKIERKDADGNKTEADGAQKTDPTEEIKEKELSRETEIFCVRLQGRAGEDVREEVSLTLAQRGIIILEMKEENQSLEHIFIELTEKEAVEEEEKESCEPSGKEN